MLHHLMDAERWQRVEHIFHAVADDPAGLDRDAKVQSLSDGDAVLIQAVRALLAAEGSLGSSSPVIDRHVGLRLGSYQVDALIARGGMASVYEAHRADDQFHQRVAIKIMDVRLSDEALVAGFRSERQILAALEHGNITRLIDGGFSGYGEPYLVMEYVDGVSIEKYCDMQRLDIAARVRLFARACAGVAFAHRNLILHRDLKPSNILVTADGVPKVVDFGTAALLQPERLTTVSRAPLTPSYASPEQLTGRPVGTASDQYSLGLVLYELLSGVPAMPHGASLIGAVERALAGKEPTPLDQVITDANAAVRGTSALRLRRQLAGDLGTVVRKALAIDPAARYASVEHLMDDLYRWLRAEVILGRTQSMRYRASRFIARHRVAVATAVLLLVSLVGATVWSLQQTRIAQRESARAREINRFMTTMLSSANPSWMNPINANAGAVTVRQALDGASELLAARPLADPAVEAEIRRVIGQTYMSLGALDQAAPHLESALALAKAQGDAFGVAVAETYAGSMLTARGDFKGAESHHRLAVAYYRAAGSRQDVVFRAGALSELANAISYQRPGDAEAIALYRESIALGDSAGSLQAVVNLHNLAVALVRRGHLDEGEAAVRESLRRMDGVAWPMPERASALRTLAVLLFQQGRYAEAEPLAREAVEFAIKTRPPNHPLLPNNKAWWGRALIANGDASRGLAVSQDALDGYSKIRPAGHQDLVLPLIGLGAACRMQGKLAESERYLREAEAIIRKFPAQRDRIADMAGELGLTLRALGRDAEADKLLRESHDILQRAYGEQHPLTRQARTRIGT
jgi:tetratricopeptide (TPR) repeat protein/tRNA A-37 threonylcarbamoyl transferase component Bud32